MYKYYGEWALIDGFNKYAVSTEGYVKNRVTGQVLSPAKVPNGYLHVTLYGHNGPKQFSVHRLVAEYHVKKIDGKNFVNHRDGDKTNNWRGNLEWCTPSENVQHALANSLQPSGYKHNQSREVMMLNLTNGYVSLHGSATKAARLIGSTQGNLCSVCRGERAHTLFRKAWYTDEMKAAGLWDD